MVDPDEVPEASNWAAQVAAAVNCYSVTVTSKRGGPASSNSVDVLWGKQKDKLNSKHTVEVRCETVRCLKCVHLSSPLLLSSISKCNFVATSQT